MIVCRFSSLDIIYVKPMKKKLVRLTGTLYRNSAKSYEIENELIINKLDYKSNS